MAAFGEAEGIGTSLRQSLHGLGPDLVRTALSSSSYPGGGVDHYTKVRLHSSIGYVTPIDMVAGRRKEIHDARDRKLEEARQNSRLRRQSGGIGNCPGSELTMILPGETEAALQGCNYTG